MRLIGRAARTSRTTATAAGAPDSDSSAGGRIGGLRLLAPSSQAISSGGGQETIARRHQPGRPDVSTRSAGIEPAPSDSASRRSLSTSSATSVQLSSAFCTSGRAISASSFRHHGHQSAPSRTRIGRRSCDRLGAAFGQIGQPGARPRARPGWRLGPRRFAIINSGRPTVSTPAGDARTERSIGFMGASPVSLRAASAPWRVRGESTSSIRQRRTAGCFPGRGRRGTGPGRRTASLVRGCLDVRLGRPVAALAPDRRSTRRYAQSTRNPPGSP